MNDSICLQASTNEKSTYTIAAKRRAQHAEQMRRWRELKRVKESKDNATRHSSYMRHWREVRRAKESEEEATLRRLQHASQMRRWRQSKRANKLQDNENGKEIREQIKHQSYIIQEGDKSYISSFSIKNIVKDVETLHTNSKTMNNSYSTNVKSKNVKSPIRDSSIINENKKNIHHDNDPHKADIKKINRKFKNNRKITKLRVCMDDIRISNKTRVLEGRNYLSPNVISISDENCCSVDRVPDQNYESYGVNSSLKKNKKIISSKNEDKKRQCNECGLVLPCEKSLLQHVQDIHIKLFKIVNWILDDPKSFQIFKYTLGIENSNIESEYNKCSSIKEGMRCSEREITKAGSNNMKSTAQSSIDPKRVCEMCGLILSCDELLVKHIETKHQNCEEDIHELESQDIGSSVSEENKVECPFCYEIFSITLIGFHVWSIHKQSFNRCSSCHLIFNSLESIIKHCIAVKIKKEAFDLLYSIKKDFADSDLYSKYPNGGMPCEMKRLLKCKSCKYICESPNAVMRHFIVVHMRPYECPRICAFCDFRSKSDDGIRKHLYTMHPESNAEKFICDKCGYITYNKRTFLIHVRNHDRHFKCEYCDYTTSLRTSIVVHRRRHTKQKPYKCDYEGCDYRSVEKSSLTTHRFTHEPEKYSQFCHICGFKTVNKYTMNTHMREHATETDVYICLQCSFTTKHKLALKAHSMVHKEVEKCLLCIFTTKYEYTMRKHMKAKHGIDVPVKTAGTKSKKHSVI